MPELPEIETIRSDLEHSVLGRRVASVQVFHDALVRAPSVEEFKKGILGRTLRAVTRRGKYLLIHLDDGLVWALHLSLEGRLLLVPSDAPVAEGTKLVVALDDARDLRLWDRVSYAATALGAAQAIDEVFHLDTLGPEPVAEGFTRDALRVRIGARRGMIKPLLLDQHVIAGVGNIYADESLWRARVHPERKAHTLSDAEWDALYRALVDTLTEGVAHRGTSAPGGLYRDLHGQKGTHQAHLAVFRRAGKPCPRCRTDIARTEVGGRSTFYCPACQHEDRPLAAPVRVRPPPRRKAVARVEKT
jgi:formamidopyrimidine-DNA glycosylase